MHIRILLPVLFATALMACGTSDQPTEAPVDQVLTLTEVFETPVAYSVRHLDSLRLEEFLLAHGEFRKDSTAIRDFYARRHFQYAWFVNDTLSQAAAGFHNMVLSADTTYREVRFLRQRLQEILVANGSNGAAPFACDSCIERLELTLTGQFFRFADKRYSGLVGKELADLNWYIPRSKKNYGSLLDSLTAGSMDLSLIEPLHPQYARLKTELRKYRDLDTLPWPVIDIGKERKLEPKAKHPSIPLIRKRLVHLGDHNAPNDSSVMLSEVYDSTLVSAMQRFQERHGLHPDAVIGQGVLKQLNITPQQRLHTLLVNMERLRWVPEHNAPDLLLVNIPEFKLHVYEQGKEVMSMVVVVGSTATRTVIFSDSLSHIVFSPTWTVPASITRGEILPAMKKDPDYLRKKNMEIIGGSASNPVIRQKPGASNALGRVKFLFPNSYSIYFHDTPSKSFFARESRAFSHGCIRLSQPQELAEYLLRNDSTWTTDKIKKAMFGGKETFVRLKEKRPVTIGYFTAWVDAEGRLQFRDDIYGLDATLARELFLVEPALAS
ncbi:MAG: L,D-transpeptidase family protein [Flavobacteriales bacterium]|nr:L,D-transpeptidase family protein [Flavobacteriales bacterium]